MNDSGERPLQFRYLVDENVSSSAVAVLREFGQEVLESRDIIGTQAPDRILEWVAFHHNCMLVSRDRDFKAIIKGAKARELRGTARTILLRGNEVREGARLRQCLPIIERFFRDADAFGNDIEYIQVLDDDLNVKYRFPQSLD